MALVKQEAGLDSLDHTHPTLIIQDGEEERYLLEYTFNHLADVYNI